MTTTVADLTIERLRRFLKRKAVPRHLDNDTEAQSDEVAALLQVLSNFVPEDPEQFDLWWPQVEAKLGLMIKSVWPTEREVAEACRLVAAKVVPFPTRAPEPQMSSAKLRWEKEIQTAADMMNAGVPIGEPWLYGMIAAEVEDRGLVPPEVFEKYRSFAYAARSRLYGNEATLAWAQERRAFQELCLQSVREAKAPPKKS